MEKTDLKQASSALEKEISEAIITSGSDKAFVYLAHKNKFLFKRCNITKDILKCILCKTVVLSKPEISSKSLEKLRTILLSGDIEAACDLIDNDIETRYAAMEHYVSVIEKKLLLSIEKNDINEYDVANNSKQAKIRSLRVARYNHVKKVSSK